MCVSNLLCRLWRSRSHILFFLHAWFCRIQRCHYHANSATATQAVHISRVKSRWVPLWHDLFVSSFKWLLFLEISLSCSGRWLHLFDALNLNVMRCITFRVQLLWNCFGTKHIFLYNKLSWTVLNLVYLLWWQSWIVGSKFTL